MGFSGGGSNVLKPHTHDGTVVQDGGSLNMDNVTQASLTAGDIVYSDGVHLQRLAIGTPAQQIQVNAGATAPEYFTAAAASSSFELIDYTAAVADTTTIDTTFTNIPGDDMVELYLVSSGCNGGNAIDIQIYDEGGNLLTTADYTNHGYTIISGTQTIINTTGQTSWLGVPGAFEPHLITMHLSLGRCGGTASTYYPRIQTFASGNTGVSHIGGTYNVASPTGISGVKFGISASNSIENGTYLAIYQVKP